MRLVKRVLITPTGSFGKFSDGYERLRRAGYEPVKAPYPHPLKEKQLLEVIQGIAGAAIDVYSQEPPATSPLLQLDNIITTPHMSADTQESIRNMDLVSVENVIRLLKGEKPIASVNFHLVKAKRKTGDQA